MKWLALGWLILLVIPAVLGECPDDCEDIVRWAGENPERIQEISNPRDFQDAWHGGLNEEQRQAAIRQDPSLFQRLDREGQKGLLRDANTVESCPSCIRQYLLAHRLADYADHRETLTTFFSDPDRLNDPDHVDQSLEFLRAASGGIDFQGLREALGRAESRLHFDGEHLCVGNCEDGAKFKLQQLSEAGIKQIVQPTPDSGQQLTLVDGEDNHLTTGAVDQLNPVERNGRPGLELIQGDRRIAIWPRSRIGSGQLAVGLSSRVEFQLWENSNVDVEAGDLTFSTYSSPSEPQHRMESTQAVLFIFGKEGLQALGRMLGDRNDPVESGRQHLRQLIAGVRNGTRADLRREKAAIRATGNLPALELLNQMEREAVARISGRRYASVRMSARDLEASNRIQIRNPHRIINNHGGRLHENRTGIVADHATLFWNIHTYEPNTGSVVAGNVVQGSWEALKDRNDQIVRIRLRAAPPPFNRAILRNDDADLEMRSDGNDVVTLNYRPDGKITHLAAEGSTGGSVKELYFGAPLPDNTRVHYLKGNAWELFLSKKEAAHSGEDRLRIHHLTNNRSA